MRGGEQLAGLIRKVEPVPLRVFLQVSSSDYNLDVSDWWIGNQAMQRSLDFAGYEVNHAWGDGGHNQNMPHPFFQTPCAGSGRTGQNFQEIAGIQEIGTPGRFF